MVILSMGREELEDWSVIIDTRYVIMNVLDFTLFNSTLNCEAILIYSILIKDADPGFCYQIWIRVSVIKSGSGFLSNPYPVSAIRIHIPIRNTSKISTVLFINH